MITANCRVNINPSQLTPLALHEVKAVEDLLPRLALAEDAQLRRKTSAADVVKARLIPHQLRRPTRNGNPHQVGWLRPAKQLALEGRVVQDRGAIRAHARQDIILRSLNDGFGSALVQGLFEDVPLAIPIRKK